MAERRSVAGIVRKEGALLVARRKPGGDLGGKWEFPGGKVEHGETPEEALKREFLEEFRVRIRVGVALCSTVFIHAGREYHLTAYSADLEPGEVFRLLEHDELEWYPPDMIAALDFADSDRKILAKLPFPYGGRTGTA